MLKIKKIILSGMIISCMMSCSSPAKININVPNTSVKTNGIGFHIKNGKLMDANGNVFVMRGVNHMHTWYKPFLDNTLTALAKRKCNAVRIVLSDGTHPDWANEWSKDKTDTIKEIISGCKKRKMVAILEVHDATGSNDIARLNNAVNYFIEIKDTLIGEEDYVLINIANEWHGAWSSNVWAEGYQKAIPKLRDAGLKHTLIIDSAGWGQYPQSIFDKGREVFASDPLRNIMFSIHMYEYAARTPAQVKDNINKALATGMALIIGEFGYKHKDGDVAEQTILDYCQKKQVGWLAWAWKGNSGGNEYLDLAKDWEGKKLSKYGKTIFNGRNGIKATSKTCTVFRYRKNKK